MNEETLYFEDFEDGRVFVSDPRTVSAEEIIEFAKEFDPQPMHLSEEAGKASILGGLSASGWHTSSITMRLFYDSVVHRSAGQGAPGIDLMEWRKPLLAGDTLRLKVTVVSKRPLSTRPEIGMVVMAHELSNQRDETILRMQGPVMVKLRNPATEVRA